MKPPCRAALQVLEIRWKRLEFVATNQSHLLWPCTCASCCYNSFSLYFDYLLAIYWCLSLLLCNVHVFMFAALFWVSVMLVLLLGSAALMTWMVHYVFFGSKSMVTDLKNIVRLGAPRPPLHGGDVSVVLRALLMHETTLQSGSAGIGAQRPRCHPALQRWR